MKTTLHIVLFFMAVFLFTACKKGPEDRMPAPGEFSTIRFIDIFDVFNIQPFGNKLKVLYQGAPFGRDGGTTLAGEARFELFDTITSTKVLDTTLQMEARKENVYIFYRPQPDKEAVTLIGMKVENEPPAAEDHIKIKIANLAQPMLGNRNIKIVFENYHPVDDVYTPVDTIAVQGMKFTDGFSEMSRGWYIGSRNRKFIMTDYRLSFLDEQENPLLNENSQPYTVELRTSKEATVYTMVIYTYTPAPGYPTELAERALFAN